MPWLVTLFGTIGSAIGGLFNFKGQQAEVMQTAISVLGNTNASQAQREQAVATIIAAEAGAGGLAAIWRPLLMLVFGGLIVSFWFGYVPPNLTAAMPPALDRVFDLLQLGIGGYIGGRSLEKIIHSLGISKVLSEFIKKKLV